MRFKHIIVSIAAVAVLFNTSLCRAKDYRIPSGHDFNKTVNGAAAILKKFTAERYFKSGSGCLQRF